MNITVNGPVDIFVDGVCVGTISDGCEIRDIGDEQNTLFLYPEKVKLDEINEQLFERFSDAMFKLVQTGVVTFTPIVMELIKQRTTLCESCIAKSKAVKQEPIIVETVVEAVDPVIAEVVNQVITASVPTNNNL